MYKHEEKILKRIKKRLEKKLKNHMVSIYAFGSRVIGDHKLWSDFDVLVVVKNKEPEIEHAIIDLFDEEEFIQQKLEEKVKIYKFKKLRWRLIYGMGFEKSAFKNN